MAAKYRAGKARPTSSLEDRLAAHRGALTRRHRVRNADQLVAMVDELGFCSQEGRLQYAKAVEELQRLMYVARVRAVGEGREDYNYTYDLFVRRYPETVRAAERLTSAEAMVAILERLLELAGGATEKQ